MPQCASAAIKQKMVTFHFIQFFLLHYNGSRVHMRIRCSLLLLLLLKEKLFCTSVCALMKNGKNGKKWTITQKTGSHVFGSFTTEKKHKIYKTMQKRINAKEKRLKLKYSQNYDDGHHFGQFKRDFAFIVCISSLYSIQFQYIWTIFSLSHFPIIVDRTPYT